MAKARFRIVDFLAYVVVRIAIALMQLLTNRAVQQLAFALAWLGYHADRRHRQVADENLRYAFPEIDAEKRDQLVRGCFRHFALLITEIARMPRKLHVGNWREHVELVNGDVLAKAMTSGRPCLLVGAHFGNWELAGYTMGLLGFRTHAIARPLDNPYLDRFLRKFREGTGQRVLAKKGDFEQMTDLLAGGGLLATLADQDAGQRGLFVNFFGRPASSHKAVALMALEYNVPLLVGGVPRVGEPMRYQVVIEDVIEPAEYAARSDAVQAITQRFTSALERLIRRNPEQYFWLHRRWKHQPKARVSRWAA
ncbi:MAG TPA: lysophospholipid acyltransferase family protein [Gemmataceae bacterium]|nr:lysophospholipid acyltransferase family protein [Gemmataceae bacterium]